MNKLLNALKNDSIYTYTENGGLTYNTTQNALEDLFGLGGSYRSRTDEDCILLFKKAYADNPTLAMKCLFYIRDREAGLGERRFFKVIIKWLAINHTAHIEKNLQYIPLYGRYDDWYAFVETPLEAKMFNEMRKQLALDVDSKTPSLLAKWMKSINSSSKETCALGAKTAKAFGMTAKQYRKTLSILRAKINVLERLMSENRWNEVEFDKIPSRAGFIYRNAFARHDVEQKYEEFIRDPNTKINADTLYPYEIVGKALKLGKTNLSNLERITINKYWNNINNVFGEYNFNGICVCDTSGSMISNDLSAPINVAISLALYCAERAKGPFANHYISFASRPQLIETNGVDFVDKVQRIYKTNLCDNTNLEAVFDLLLSTIEHFKLKEKDLPKNIIVISDMAIDESTGDYYNNFHAWTKGSTLTEMEKIRVKWKQHGYNLPRLIYWNVDARNDLILDAGKNVTFVSGMSPNIFTQIMTGKIGRDFILSILNSERYSCIY